MLEDLVGLIKTEWISFCLSLKLQNDIKGGIIHMYRPNDDRYKDMIFNFCGRSGLKLPAISLGLYQNFSKAEGYDTPRKMIQTAFDLGVTHFDIANNYGDGHAEVVFGKILKEDFKGYRDEMIISTKAGYEMWPGPYGDWGSRKSLISSLDQSLNRLNLDYVDIFYHHRPDPNTPLEETAGALDTIVKQGKALYVGVSNYAGKEAKEMATLLKEQKTPFIIHQPQYSMFTRKPEEDLFPVLEKEGIGAIAFQPLLQGLLTSKYLKHPHTFSDTDLLQQQVEKVSKLNQIAESREQTMAQMAIAWVFQQKAVVSALVGASRPEQIIENVNALKQLIFSVEELRAINDILMS